MTSTIENTASELEMLRSKLTVLEKGRHDDPECDAKIEECRKRILELEAEEKGTAA